MCGKVEIILNSFIRKTANAAALKQLIVSTGATLSRKGRSRHWVLLADAQQILVIIDLIHQSGEQAWFWLPKKLLAYKPHLTYNELLNLARLDSDMTVKKLMSATDCTLLEARAVIDQLEWE